MNYRALGHLTEAKDKLERAVQLDPDSQKAHYQLGLVLTALKDNDSARVQLAVASRLRSASDDKVAWVLAPPSTGTDHAANEKNR